MKLNMDCSHHYELVDGGFKCRECGHVRKLGRHNMGRKIGVTGLILTIIFLGFVFASPYSFLSLEDQEKVKLKIIENIPEIDIPEIDIPEIDIPEIDIPEIDIPEIDIPEIDIPEIDISSNSSTSICPENMQLLKRITCLQKDLPPSEWTVNDYNFMQKQYSKGCSVHQVYPDHACYLMYNQIMDAYAKRK
jgi:hypothetical protein